MTDEGLIERLAQTLRAEASTVTSPADAWERFNREGVTVLRPNRRLWLGVPVAMVAVAAAIVLLVAVAQPGGRGTSVATGRSSAAAPVVGAAASAAGGTAGGASGGVAAAPAPAPSGNVPAAGGATATAVAGGPVPAGFEPASVTFVSAADGWVLGTAPCTSAPCTSILRTTDGGHTWVGSAAPPAVLGSAVTTLRFADSRDGWAWGAELWSTHDGGATWHQVTLPGGGTVTALEASAGSVQAAVFDGNGHVDVETSPVGSDAWRLDPVVVPVGGGPVPHTQIVLQGSSGWLVQVDRVVVGGARLVNGQWAAWTPPCESVEGPALLAAATPSDLVAACDVGQWSTPQGEHLFVSHDGGATFSEVVGSIPGTGGIQVLASSGGRTIVAGGSSTSQPANRQELVQSFDAGATWSVRDEGDQGAGWSDLGFTTATQGVAVKGPPGGENAVVIMTRDGGHDWAPVSF